MKKTPPGKERGGRLEDQRRLGNSAWKLELGFERWIGIGPLCKRGKDNIEGAI